MKTLIYILFLTTLTNCGIVNKLEIPFYKKLEVEAGIILKRNRNKVLLCQPRYSYTTQVPTPFGDCYIYKTWNGKLEIGDTVYFTMQERIDLKYKK